MKVKVFFSKENEHPRVEVKKTFASVMGVAGVLSLGAFLGGNDVSAANINDSTMISPAYQRYAADVAAGNGANWKIIPNKYVANGTIGGRGGDSNLPAAYSLIDAGYAPTLKNQGTDGDCWAFATTAAIESNLKKTKGVDYEFSPKQLDYLMASGSPYYDLFSQGTGETRELGDAGNFAIASYALTGQRAPVSESSFYAKMQANDAELGSYTSWRQYQDLNGVFGEAPYTKTIDTVQLLGDRADYLVKDYRLYWGDTEDIARVKSDVYNNGAVYVATYAPETEDCWDVDTKTIVDLNDTVCGAENGHAMSVIGWDDNHVYTDPSDGRTKTGAFLIQNSWGAASLMTDYGITYERLVELGMIDESALTTEDINELKDYINNYNAYEYVWLGYDFDDSADGTINFASVRDVEANSYDKVYDQTMELIGLGGDVVDDALIYTYSTGNEVETIKEISVAEHNTVSMVDLYFDVYVDTTGTGNHYQKVGTTTTVPAYEGGVAMLKLSNPIGVAGTFKIKAVPMTEAGETEGIDEVSAYFTASVYTNRSEGGSLAVPDTGLSTGRGVDAIFGGVAMIVVTLMTGALALAVVRNRKHLFNKVKFEKKGF